MELVKRIWSEEEGQGLAEYGLILALIAVVCILALTGLGQAIVTKLGQVVTGLGGGGYRWDRWHERIVSTWIDRELPKISFHDFRGIQSSQF